MKALFTACLCFGLAACATGPDFTRPAPPPGTAYLAPGEKAPQITGDLPAAETWWQMFGSADLDALVRQGLAGNHDLAAAQATLTQALDLAAAAGGTLAPAVDAAAGAQRQRVNFAAFGIKAPAAVFNLYQAGPAVSYDLDLFGGHKRRAEAATAEAEAAAYQRDAAALALTGNIVIQAVTFASLQAQMTATRAIIADDEENLRLVRTAKEAGSATEVDLLHAASQLAADRTLLPPLGQRLAAVRHLLAVLTGKAPADWSPPDFDLDGFRLPDRLPVTLPSALVRRRPDILAAEAELHAAGALVGAAEADRYPDITLSATLLLQATQLGQLFREGNAAVTAGGGLSAPLFHGDALEARGDAAKAAHEAAAAHYRQIVLRAFGQVADALTALAGDTDQLAAETAASAAAEGSLRLTRLSFAAGNSGVLQVLDAQRQVQQARLGLIRARAERCIDTAQLLLAMGGGPKKGFADLPE